MMIWYVPDISDEMKTVWYLMFYCLFRTFLSVNMKKNHLSRVKPR